MSTRLKSRVNELEPDRIEYAVSRINELGIDTFQTDKSIAFTFNGATVTLYPYTGWFTGKSVKDGRGIHNLLKQLKAQ